MRTEITGHYLLALLEAQQPLPVVATVKCASIHEKARVGMELSLRGYQHAFYEKTPLDLECSGPRMSRPAPYEPTI